MVEIDPYITAHRLLSFCWSYFGLSSAEGHPVKRVKNFEEADNTSIIHCLALQLDKPTERKVAQLIQKNLRGFIKMTPLRFRDLWVKKKMPYRK